LNLTKTQTKQAHPSMTSHMMMISEEYLYLKRPLLLFSILWHSLSKFVTQTGLYCSKQLETTFSSIL